MVVNRRSISNSSRHADGDEQGESAKRDHIYRTIPSPEVKEYKRPPSRERFNRALFPRGQRELLDSEWDGLFDILETYRKEAGYPLSHERRRDFRDHVGGLKKSLASVRDRLRPFQSDRTPPGNVPKTLGDILSFVDSRARLEGLPGSDRTFEDLASSVAALLARTELLEEIMFGTDSRWLLGQLNLVWDVRTPWVRMVLALQGWAEAVGVNPAVGGRETPFMRLVSEATQTLGRDFEDEGSGFGKAIADALNYQRY